MHHRVLVRKPLNTAWLNVAMRPQRVVVHTTDYAGTSAQHQAELQAIVDSVQIEP